MAPDRRAAFVVNVKANSHKIHKVTRETIHLPQSQQRLRCGWRMTQSTSRVFSCVRLRWGSFCLKCFPNAGSAAREQNDEDIEQFR